MAVFIPLIHCYQLHYTLFFAKQECNIAYCFLLCIWGQFAFWSLYCFVSVTRIWYLSTASLIILFDLTSLFFMCIMSPRELFIGSRTSSWIMQQLSDRLRINFVRFVCAVWFVYSLMLCRMCSSITWRGNFCNH